MGFWFWCQWKHVHIKRSSGKPFISINNNLWVTQWGRSTSRGRKSVYNSQLKQPCLGQTLEYEQSLFPLKDSRGKRTSRSEREITCRVETWRTCRVASVVSRKEIHYISSWTRASRFNDTGDFPARPLACSFPLTIPRRKERLLVV